MQYFISHSSILSIAFALTKKSILCPKCTFLWTALLPCPLYISKWNVITYFSQGNETAFRIKSFIHTVISFVKKVLAHTNFYSGYTLSKPAWFFFPTIKIFKDDVNIVGTHDSPIQIILLKGSGSMSESQQGSEICDVISEKCYFG